MNKPVFGLVVGGILGIFDGLSALVSSPEVSSQIAGIVIGSTFKGLIAGVLIGWFAKNRWPLSGFVAPAWLLGPGARQAVAERPFEYTATLRQLIHLPGQADSIHGHSPRRRECHPGQCQPAALKS